MKIINEVENKLFGKLCCFANDEGEPLFWGKQLKMKFLSQEEQNVVIGLNLYCFDVNFNTKGWDDEDVDSVLKEIYSQYQIFLSDCKGIDETLPPCFSINPRCEVPFAEMDY